MKMTVLLEYVPAYGRKKIISYLQMIQNKLQ